MKLAEEETTQPQQNYNDFHQKEAEKAFLKPFKTFQRSITLSIQIHFLRFLLVTIIYFYSDIFLLNQKNISEPWNSLLYFLAIMIEVIKFIGDCSLRVLLKNEEKKICQIHEFKLKTKNGSDMLENIRLKGAKYEDYMSIFSIIRLFKYQHKNYSSAYSISKYMHLIATFLVFGWMSLTEQYREENNWLQLVVLELFLYSIYFTSFQIDLLLIETSEGKLSDNHHNCNVSTLSPNQARIVMKNFIKWRKNYLIIQSVGTLFVLLGVIINFKLTLLFFSAIFVVAVNLLAFRIEQMIKNCSKLVVKSMTRNQINTYSLLKNCTSQFNTIFQSFILIQRFSFIFLWFSFARDQSLSLQNFCILGLGIFLLALSQIEKFSDGNRLKLMSILQDSYPNNVESQSQSEKELECAICLKFFEKGDSVNFLPCSKDHIFHSSCFQDWKKIKTQCPLCRYPLSEYI